MKKIHFLFLTIVLTSLATSSCSFEKKAIKKGYCHCDTAKIIVHDTTEKIVLDSTSLDTIVFSADSMYIDALFVCDSNKNVQMISTEFYKGKYFEVLQKLNNGHYQVQVKYKDRMVVIPRHFRSESNTHTADAKETIVATKKYIPKFYKWCFWTVLVEIFLAIIYLVYRYAKWYTKMHGINLVR